MQIVLAIVLAGGEGSRLRPLTANRCKPALPFRGQHVLVDFVLSNLVNSQLVSIDLLVQSARPLIEHVARNWAPAPGGPGPSITVLPPRLQGLGNRYLGTADAVFQNIDRIEEPAYWRDVGTIDAYFEAQFDTVGPWPKFSMTNPLWPIRAAAEPGGPARIDGGTLGHCSFLQTPMPRAWRLQAHVVSPKEEAASRQATQFSTFRPLTRRNSRSLLVTSTQACASA